MATNEYGIDFAALYRDDSGEFSYEEEYGEEEYFTDDPEGEAAANRVQAYLETLPTGQLREDLELLVALARRAID